MDNIAENAILTLEQKEFLISFMQSELNSLFYLTGGTSLSAFYLQHRLSEDLDFFTEQDVYIENILVFLRSIPAIKQISYERKYDRKIFLLEYPQTIFLKVEFTKYPFKQLAPPQDFGGLLVDSIQDILSNKLMAMTDRRDPKDYYARRNGPYHIFSSRGNWCYPRQHLHFAICDRHMPAQPLMSGW